jgi:hypothetical protein
MSAWTDFVSKVYHENHKKNPNYSFKDALKEASRRKGEMGSGVSKHAKGKKRGTKKRTMRRRKHASTRRRH